MSLTTDEFARRCSDLLKAEPGPPGREKVCELLRQVLRDPQFVESAVPESTASRELLYEDPDLKFCIFAERKRGAKVGNPHDHGPSWAIYAQAAGETEMTEWEVVERATAEKPGKVRASKRYTMTPGSAYLFNEGVFHSPSRTAPTRLIRVEGMNLEELRAKRPKYEVVG